MRLAAATSSGEATKRNGGSNPHLNPQLYPYLTPNCPQCQYCTTILQKCCLQRVQNALKCVDFTILQGEGGGNSPTKFWVAYIGSTTPLSYPFLHTLNPLAVLLTLLTLHRWPLYMTSRAIREIDHR